MIAVCLLQQQLQGLLVQVLLYVPVDFPQVIDINVVLVSPVILLEYHCNRFFVLV